MSTQNKSKTFSKHSPPKKSLHITLDQEKKKANSELGNVFNSFTEIFGFNKKEGGTK